MERLPVIDRYKDYKVGTRYHDTKKNVWYRLELNDTGDKGWYEFKDLDDVFDDSKIICLIPCDSCPECYLYKGEE